jgi:hypothetical protein
MAKKIKQGSLEEKNPIDALRSMGVQIEGKMRDLVRLCESVEGREKVGSWLEGKPQDVDSGFSKKQLWVLKAMQMDADLESQIFEYAQFCHAKNPASKRILIRGINDESKAAESNGKASKG